MIVRPSTVIPVCPFTGSVCNDNCIFRRERLSSADKPCVIAEACRVLVACKECTEPFSK